MLVAIELCRLEGRWKVDWQELLTQLVGISYLGDVRMTLGVEPKDKLTAIAVGQFNELKGIYGPIAHRHGIDAASNTVDLSSTDFQNTVTQRLGLQSPVYSHDTLRSRIAQTNRRTSTRMAMSQLVAGHPVKNVG